MDELLYVLGPFLVLAVMCLGGAAISRTLWRVRGEADASGGLLIGRGVPRLTRRRRWGR